MKYITILNSNIRSSKQAILRGVYLLLPMFCLCTHSFAQDDSQYVIASQGDYSISSEMQLSWTLGESHIETVASSDIMLTQGFQQSFFEVNRIEVPIQTAFEAKIYPNPTQGMLTVEIFEKDTKCQLEIYDVSGRLLQKYESDINISSIDLTSYNAGQYFIRLSNTDQSKLSLFEIIKL